MARERSRLRTLAPIGAMIAIQLASGIPSPVWFDTQGAADFRAPLSSVLFAPGEQAVNLAHIPVFGVLAWLCCWACQSWTDRTASAGWFGAAIAFAFAVLNEASQLVLPSRHATLPDVGLNLIGILSVWVRLSCGTGGIGLASRGRWYRVTTRR